MSQEALTFLSADQVHISHENCLWRIAGKRREVMIDETTLALTVRAGAAVWAMSPAAVDDLVVEAGGTRHPLSLADAATRSIEPYDNGDCSGVKVELSDFTRDGVDFDLRLQLFVALDLPDEELLCTAAATEGQATLKELQWPKAFVPGTTDAAVIPNRQGMLLPKDWAHELKYDLPTHAHLYMPWWGHQQNGAAAMVILETPDDAALRIEHPAGGPTTVQMRWLHQLGHWGYPRRARLVFFDQGDYVTLAKRYRRYAKETGLFVALDEKIARQTQVERMIGAPVIGPDISVRIQPESSFYGQHPEKLTSFAERAKQVRALAARGVERAHVLVKGWGVRGYDNLHPDFLPPCPEAGGWEGMRALSDACREVGFQFAIHDNYRDYYHDAPSFNKEYAVHHENGDVWSYGHWYGGTQCDLCASQAPGLFRRNLLALEQGGVRMDGVYLDVFAVVAPEECYHPDHPMTRRQCMEYRAACFDLARTRAGVIGSEEPCDWAVPCIDWVDHVHTAEADGRPAGIPVPLFSLVYHDAMLVPWNDRLQAALNAGLPWMSLTPDDAELERARALCALHRRVGRLEMTRHEFLDDSHQLQRSTFADGTAVTVDFETGSLEIAAGGAGNPNYGLLPSAAAAPAATDSRPA
jgi:hypothetical protein